MGEYSVPRFWLQTDATAVGMYQALFEPGGKARLILHKEFTWISYISGS